MLSFDILEIKRNGKDLVVLLLNNSKIIQQNCTQKLVIELYTVV